MARQQKAPNTRNKKEVQALSEFAAVAASREFLQLKTPEAQKLYEAYQSALKNAPAEEEYLIGVIKDTLTSSLGISPDIASIIAPEAYARFSSGAFQQTLLNASPDTTPSILISLSDYQRFSTFCYDLEDFPPQAKALLLSLIVFYRRNYHPSNWVRYDRKNIFFLAGLHLKSPATQETLTQYLHKFCGLNMRVVGSNQPIVCFDFPWIHDQPPVGDPSNPLVNLGPLSPASLKAVIAKLESAPDAQPPHEDNI